VKVSEQIDAESVIEMMVMMVVMIMVGMILVVTELIGIGCEGFMWLRSRSNVGILQTMQ